MVSDYSGIRYNLCIPLFSPFSFCSLSSEVINWVSHHQLCFRTAQAFSARRAPTRSVTKNVLHLPLFRLVGRASEVWYLRVVYIVKHSQTHTGSFAPSCTAQVFSTLSAQLSDSESSHEVWYLRQSRAATPRIHWVSSSKCTAQASVSRSDVLQSLGLGS